MLDEKQKNELMKNGGWSLKLATAIWSVLFGLFWWYVITTLAL